jgi:hypothetical protein
MDFYAYCLLRLEPNDPWPVMRGIEEHPVFPLRCGKYAMLLSRIERNFPFSPRSIVEHGQVIANAFETRTVLPMRFGTFFHSEKQIANLIRGNQEKLLEAFCHLRGKAEMRLKLLFQTENGAPKGEKKPPQKTLCVVNPCANAEGCPMDSRNMELAHHLMARVSSMFHPLEQQIFCRLIHNHEMLVDCAHLIDSQKVENYQKLHTLASEQEKGWDLRISGPWPPYHFLPASVQMPAPAAFPALRRVSAGAR